MLNWLNNAVLVLSVGYLTGCSWNNTRMLQSWTNPQLGTAPLQFTKIAVVAVAPSDFAVIGRYILDPAVFDVLKETVPGRGGEIQLTDALRTLASMPAEAGGGVHGINFTGRRYDTGDRLSYLQAVIQLACERDDIGADLRAWLTAYVTD